LKALFSAFRNRFQHWLTDSVIFDTSTRIDRLLYQPIQTFKFLLIPVCLTGESPSAGLTRPLPVWNFWVLPPVIAAISELHAI
jgi:hypothetical protein